MIFLQKIFSLISPTNDVCPSIRFFVIRKFRFTLPASNEVNWSASLWTWSANTVMCVASHGSWTEQDWQRHFDYGVQQIISRHPHILLTFWVKKTVFFFFLRVSLLLWPAIIGTPVQAYARRIRERAFHIFLLFTDQCRKEWCRSRWLILLLLFFSHPSFNQVF